MKHRGKQTIILAGLLGGCMPLEQAPLVYSSKNQIGVGVAAGTPDSPGLDVNIGYKGLDAAFVPVAVAKKCPAGHNCALVNYNIEVIKGDNKLSGQGVVDSQLLLQYGAAITAADRKITETSSAISVKQGQLASLDALPDRLKRQAELSATVDAAGAPIVRPGPEIEEKTKLDVEIAELQKLQSQRATLQQDIVNLRGLNTDTAEARAEAQAAQRDLLARKDIRTGDDKVDALSVYGSFNGNASGEAKGAGLKLGKVFSTGIAAQNLSQGIRNSAHIEATARCLETARALIGTTVVDAALLTAVARSCGAERE